LDQEHTIDRDRKQDYAYFRVMYWGHCYRSYSTPA
jgi:hypothetical protein